MAFPEQQHSLALQHEIGSSPQQQLLLNYNTPCGQFLFRVAVVRLHNNPAA